jgi:hypothetical protein
MLAVRKNAATLVALALGAVLSCPQPALACAVCYGQTDSPLARGLVWGILALLGVLLAVLGGVAWFFVHMGRRAGAAARPSEATAESAVRG